MGGGTGVAQDLLRPRAKCCSLCQALPGPKALAQPSPPQFLLLSASLFQVREWKAQSGGTEVDREGHPPLISCLRHALQLASQMSRPWGGAAGNIVLHPFVSWFDVPAERNQGCP